jgi:hypothetical protein
MVGWLQSPPFGPVRPVIPFCQRNALGRVTQPQRHCFLTRMVGPVAFAPPVAPVVANVSPRVFSQRMPSTLSPLCRKYSANLLFGVVIFFIVAVFMA